MGKHAMPRKPSRAGRTAVVSAGTLLLCLGTAAPALADIGPVPVPQPVDDAVTQVSDATGLPNPLKTVEDATGSTTDSPKPAHHAKHKQHHTKPHLTTSTLTPETTTNTSTGHTPRHAKRAHLPGPAATSAPYTYGGLRGVPMTTTSPLVDSGRAPVTAGAASGDTAVLAAGSSPTLVRPSAAMLDGAGGEDGPRVVLIGLAAMVLGGLSAGHIKIAQDRIAQVIG